MRLHSNMVNLIILILFHLLLTVGNVSAREGFLTDDIKSELVFNAVFYLNNHPDLGAAGNVPFLSKSLTHHLYNTAGVDYIITPV